MDTRRKVSEMAIPLYNEAGECIGIQNEPDWQRADGRRAAENGQPRKCPCYMPDDRALWFEGYDRANVESIMLRIICRAFCWVILNHGNGLEEEVGCGESADGFYIGKCTGLSSVAFKDALYEKQARIWEK